MQQPKNGDDFLSSHERHLWELCYSTLELFGCPTMFKRAGPDLPRRIDEHIKFFVPRGHPRAAEVVTYLQHETKRFAHIEQQRPEGEQWFWNTYVEILPFSGFQGYLDRDTSEKMAEDFANSVVAAVNELLGGRRKSVN